MNAKILFTLSLLLCLSACSKDNEPTTPPCNDEEYGTVFTIHPGETYCFSDNTELKIVSLINEFCPCNLQCFWEGQMTISMEWTMPDGALIEYNYNTAPQLTNEDLPDGLVISYLLEDFTFAEECTESVPSPEIIEAKITILK